MSEVQTNVSVKTEYRVIESPYDMLNTAVTVSHDAENIRPFYVVGRSYTPAEYELFVEQAARALADFRAANPVA